MCTPFNQLVVWLENLLINESVNFSFAISSALNFVKKAVELDLGYLFFNRSIPSLSGGELQRLRLVQVFNTQLTDLLIVLDEPLAGISGSEKILVFNNIVELSKKHTILVIDHGETFIPQADVVIALGIGSGKYGGTIINTEKYIKSQKIDFKCEPIQTNDMILIDLKNSIYLFEGVTIKITPKNLNLILGKSGVGKSTLLREYLPQYFEKYTYISQKPIVGKSNSTIATLIEISTLISTFFAKHFSKEKNFFQL